ncbi:MAG TPA: hypothetical protein DCF33_13435, partial [Saprospirales bacterium]|nr:hypothetical protein [Saprospirales bacterium]
FLLLFFVFLVFFWGFWGFMGFMGFMFTCWGDPRGRPSGLWWQEGATLVVAFGFMYPGMIFREPDLKP